MKSLSRDPKSFNMELLTVALQFKGPGVKSLASAEKNQEIAMLNFHKDITCSNRWVQCGSLFEGRGCKFSLLTHLSDVNFWFGREQGEENMTAIDEKLSLLKQTFNLFVEYKKISYSEVIEKIDNKDKSCQNRGKISQAIPYNF